MNIDADKIDEAVLALLYLTLHEESRAWKSFVPRIAAPLPFSSFLRPGYDELKIISSSIAQFCLTGADGEQLRSLGFAEAAWLPYSRK